MMVPNVFPVEMHLRQEQERVTRSAAVRWMYEAPRAAEGGGPRRSLRERIAAAVGSVRRPRRVAAATA